MWKVLQGQTAARAKEEERFNTIGDLTRKMIPVTSKQKNVSNDIKDGLAWIERKAATS